MPPHDASAPVRAVHAPAAGATDPGSGSAANPRVLIVGGGFGGTTAARILGVEEVDVTLLDRSTSSLFEPLLYQCATGILSEGSITRPLREMFARHRTIEVILGEATDIDPIARTVTATRPGQSRFEIGYDYLILAAGMRQSYFGHDEFEQFAPGMKTLADALEVRRRIYGAFEMAETLPAEQQAEWMTFAVVGAGPTGVELAGQIRELATQTIEDEFHHIDPRQARVLLFDGVDEPLKSFGPQLAASASRQLDRLGVQQHMDTRVTDIDDTGLVATDADGREERYEARTVIWTAGVQAVAFADRVAAALGVQPDRQGRIPVGPDLTVAGHDEIFVIGDVMALDDLPGLAEVALQTGLYAGRRIHRRVAAARGESIAAEIKPFRYRDLGTAAYISRFHAVVKIGPVRFSGALGWLLWGLIHITTLSGGRNRLAALSSWMFQITRGKRNERAITPATAATPTSEPEAR